MDGTMQKTNKSLLMNELELDAQSVDYLPDSNIESAIVIHLITIVQVINVKNLVTFSDLSQTLCELVEQPLRECNIIVVVPDRYDITNSIK